VSAPPASALSNHELLATVTDLVRRSNAITAELLIHLAEVDARKLYAEQGFSSLFAWCTEELGLSEGATYKRIRAARVARSFPAVLDFLREGRVHLSGIGLLAPHLTADNHLSLLEAVSGKGKREVEKLLADLAPRPDVADKVRKLPRRAPVAPARGPSPAPEDSRTPPPSTVPGDSSLAPPPPPGPVRRRRSDISPLGGDRYKVELTADNVLVEKLREAQALLSHRVPDGDLAVVVGEALELLCRKVERERFGAPRKPSPSPAPDPIAGGPRPPSRHIPNGVKRQVWERDEGRCS